MNPALANFTLDDCYEILNKNSINNTVESYEFFAFDEKLGYLGDHCYLEIKYRDCNESKTLRLFTKAMCSVESQRVFTIESGAFLKECRMFQKLIPKFLENDIHIIKDCIPTCYLISDMNYLVFEDLGMQGYRTLSQRESMDLACVKSCLKTLAKFHASALLLEEKIEAETGEKFRLPENFPEIFKETFYSSVNSSRKLLESTKKGASTQIDIFEDPASVNVELFKKLTFSAFDQFPEIVKPSSAFRNTVCHGDLWSFNAMLKFEGDKPTHCRIVDFQSYRYGPPAQDFLGFIYLSTDRLFRQQHMEEVTSYYYRQMTKVLAQHDISIKKVLPYAEFVDSCDYYKLFSIAQAINHYQVIMVPPETAKSLFAISGALQKMLFEDRSPVLREMCLKDEVYKRRMLESITDLRDVFLEKGLMKLD